jgi:hypothetical protein
MKVLALYFGAMECSSKTGKLNRGKTICEYCLEYLDARYHERRCHCSYLFAPVTKANSWLSLVSQGGNPILLEDSEENYCGEKEW